MNNTTIVVLVLIIVPLLLLLIYTNLPVRVPKENKEQEKERNRMITKVNAMDIDEVINQYYLLLKEHAIAAGEYQRCDMVYKFTNNADKKLAEERELFRKKKVKIYNEACFYRNRLKDEGIETSYGFVYDIDKDTEIVGTLEGLYKTMSIDEQKRMLNNYVSVVTKRYSDVPQKEKSVVGQAVVGGIIAGPAGAVVGALNAVDKNNKIRSEKNK